MRVLVLSDIHSNLDALEAVLSAAPAYDVVWNLGDVVGYGAQPNEVIARAQDLGSVIIRGNHDRAAAGLLSLADFNPIAARAARWTRKALAPERLEWLRSLPQGPVTISTASSTGASSTGAQDTKMTCMHGSILDEDEYLLSIEDAIPSLCKAQTRMNFFGHTHRQGGFAANDEDWFTLKPVYSSRDDADSWELNLVSGARYLINPGSVGQPRDGDWRAAFAICDTGRKIMEYHRVPYDVHRAQTRILEAGLPDSLALRLQAGK